MRATFALALLLICLIGTQWVGLDHSITHASYQQQASAQINEDNFAPSLSHSSSACHLFDALTLAGFVGSFYTSSNTVLLFARAFLLPIAPADSQQLNTHYHSRAPPTFIL